MTKKPAQKPVPELLEGLEPTPKDTFNMSVHVNRENYYKLKAKYGNMTRFIDGLMAKIVKELNL